MSNTTTAATRSLVLQVQDGTGWADVRPASSRSNGKRDGRKAAERTGRTHRLVVTDGWDDQPEVLATFPGTAEDTAAELELVGDEPTTIVVLVPRDAELDEMTGCGAWDSWTPARKVDHVARHADRTARGPMLQTRPVEYDGDGPEGADGWDDVRRWDCLYRGRRAGRALVKKTPGYVARLVVLEEEDQAGPRVLWSSDQD